MLNTDFFIIFKTFLKKFKKNLIDYKMDFGVDICSNLEKIVNNPNTFNTEINYQSMREILLEFNSQIDTIKKTLSYFETHQHHLVRDSDIQPLKDQLSDTIKNMQFQSENFANELKELRNSFSIQNKELEDRISNNIDKLLDERNISSETTSAVLNKESQVNTDSSLKHDVDILKEKFEQLAPLFEESKLNAVRRSTKENLSPHYFIPSVEGVMQNSFRPNNDEETEQIADKNIIYGTTQQINCLDDQLHENMESKTSFFDFCDKQGSGQERPKNMTNVHCLENVHCGDLNPQVKNVDDMVGIINDLSRNHEMILDSLKEDMKKLTEDNEIFKAEIFSLKSVIQNPTSIQTTDISESTERVNEFLTMSENKVNEVVDDNKKLKSAINELRTQFSNQTSILENSLHEEIMKIKTELTGLKGKMECRLLNINDVKLPSTTESVARVLATNKTEDITGVDCMLGSEDMSPLQGHGQEFDILQNKLSKSKGLNAEFMSQNSDQQFNQMQKETTITNNPEIKSSVKSVMPKTSDDSITSPSNVQQLHSIQKAFQTVGVQTDPYTPEIRHFNLSSQTVFLPNMIITNSIHTIHPDEFKSEKSTKDEPVKSMNSVEHQIVDKVIEENMSLQVEQTVIKDDEIFLELKTHGQLIEHLATKVNDFIKNPLLQHELGKNDDQIYINESIKKDIKDLQECEINAKKTLHDHTEKISSMNNDLIKLKSDFEAVSLDLTDVKYNVLQSLKEVDSFKVDVVSSIDKLNNGSKSSKESLEAMHAEVEEVKKMLSDINQNYSDLVKQGNGNQKNVKLKLTRFSNLSIEPLPIFISNMSTKDKSRKHTDSSFKERLKKEGNKFKPQMENLKPDQNHNTELPQLSITSVTRKLSSGIENVDPKSEKLSDFQGKSKEKTENIDNNDIETNRESSAHALVSDSANTMTSLHKSAGKRFHTTVDSSVMSFIPYDEVEEGKEMEFVMSQLENHDNQMTIIRDAFFELRTKLQQFINNISSQQSHADIVSPVDLSNLDSLNQLAEMHANLLNDSKIDEKFRSFTKKIDLKNRELERSLHEIGKELMSIKQFNTDITTWKEEIKKGIYNDLVNKDVHSSPYTSNVTSIDNKPMKHNTKNQLLIPPIQMNRIPVQTQPSSLTITSQADPLVKITHLTVPSFDDEDDKEEKSPLVDPPRSLVAGSAHIDTSSPYSSPYKFSAKRVSSPNRAFHSETLSPKRKQINESYPFEDAKNRPASPHEFFSPVFHNVVRQKVEDISILNAQDSVDEQIIQLIMSVKLNLQMQIDGLLERFNKWDDKIDTFVDKEYVSKFFTKMRITIEDINRTVEFCKGQLPDKATKEYVQSVIEDLYRAFAKDESTSGGTKNYRCLLCGRPKTNISGMIIDKEVAQGLGNPSISLATKTNTGGTLIYGPDKQLYRGKSNFGRTTLSKADEKKNNLPSLDK